MKKVKIYEFDVCPYCENAKALLRAFSVEFEEIVITREEIAELSKKTGMMTAPQIFFDEELIGGFDDLNALVQAGQLDERLGR